jgi:hypothetical protein
MPLDGYDKMRGAVELDGLNHIVGRGDGADDESIADGADGLMMTGIDRCFEPVSGNKQGGRQHCCEPRSWGDMDGMGIENFPAGVVIDRCRQVLNQRAIPPDIEALQTGADGEDRLMEVKGVLQQELVDGGAGRISGTAFRDTGVTVSFRVNVVATAWKQDPLNGEENAGNAILSFMKGNQNRCHAGGMEGGQIGRKRALVVS